MSATRLPAVQADRDHAGDLIHACAGGRETAFETDVRNGIVDGSHEVQAFARARAGKEKRT